MPSIPLCDGDPVVEYLRGAYGANFVRIPRASLRPLTVLAAPRVGPVKTMGQLSDILVPDSENALGQVGFVEEPVPLVRGHKTGALGLKFGLLILGGLLQGLGASNAGLSSAFDAKSTISFSFHDVHLVSVELNRLSRALQNRTVDRTAPAAAQYFREDDPARLLLVDTVLTSPGFMIVSSRSSTNSADIDVPLLQQIVSGTSAGVTLSSSSSHVVRFDGPQRLTFAFTCQVITLDHEGHMAFAGQGRRAVVQGVAASEAAARLPVPRIGVLLSDEPALLDIDERDTDGVPAL